MSIKNKEKLGFFDRFFQTHSNEESNKYDIDRIFGLYNEIISSENLLSIENLSIDFMVQNNLSFNDFEESIQTFKRTFYKRGLYRIFEDDYIKLSLSKKSLFASNNKLAVLTVQKETGNNILLARFSENDEIDSWFRNQIQKKLKDGIPLKILEGVILIIDDGKTKVLFNDQFSKSYLEKENR